MTVMNLGYVECMVSKHPKELKSSHRVRVGARGETEVSVEFHAESYQQLDKWHLCLYI